MGSARLTSNCSSNAGQKTGDIEALGRRDLKLAHLLKITAALSVDTGFLLPNLPFQPKPLKFDQKNYEITWGREVRRTHG